MIEWRLMINIVFVRLIAASLMSRTGVADQIYTKRGLFLGIKTGKPWQTG